MEKVKDSVSFLSVMTKSKALLSLFVFIAVMSEARSIVMSKALKILKSSPPSITGLYFHLIFCHKNDLLDNIAEYKAINTMKRFLKRPS